MLYFIKRSFTCLTKEIFVPLYRALVGPHREYTIQANCPYLKKDIHHLVRIQLAATRWVKGRDSKPLKKRRIRNDLVLTHKTLYNQTDMEATQLFRFSRTPGLRFLQ